jgi:hypothetical protein
MTYESLLPRRERAAAQRGRAGSGTSGGRVPIPAEVDPKQLAIDLARRDHSTAVLPVPTTRYSTLTQRYQPCGSGSCRARDTASPVIMAGGSRGSGPVTRHDELPGRGGAKGRLGP